MIGVRFPINRHRFFSPLFSNFQNYFSTSVAAVPDYPADDGVSQILTHLNSCGNNKIKVNLNSLRGDNWFKNVASKLGPEEVGTIINNLCVENAENAIEFFFFLQNELGVKHSRVSQFIIAHILAGKQRPRALLSHLHQVLHEDGSGSAPSLCELLCNTFRGWDSSHMVLDMLAFVYSRTNMVHDALFVLARMKDLDIQPSIMTYNSLLHNLRHTDIMWDVYSEIKASGNRPSEYTNSIILDGLCKQSLIHEAILFLQETKEKEAEPCVVSFNTLISGFCKMGFVDIAKSFFCMMFKCGLFPDVYSYNILIHGLCVAGLMEEALDFTNDMEKHGIGPDQVTYNIIAKGFRLLGMMDDGWKVTNRMLHRGLNTDLVTYTILICGHCQTGNVEEGFRLLEEMLSRGLQPSSISYSVLLSSLCKSGRIGEALSFLSEMQNAGLKPDDMMYSIIIHGLCKLGEVKRAVQLHKEMCLKKITIDYVPHKAMLFGLCKKGAVSEARSYFDKVADSDLMEDIVLYNIMINKYAKLGNIGEAIQLYKIAMLKGISPTIVTFNSLIYGFCKTRKLSDAKKWFNNIKMQGLVPTVVTYTTLMNAFCEEGNLEATFELLEEMEASSVQATRVTYTVIMKGLCRQGKLEESTWVLRNMIAKGLSPDQTSYNALIQRFCKARYMKRAFQLHDEMLLHNLQPNHITYNILINGLCVYGDLKDADKLFSSLKDQNVRLSKVAYTTLIKAHCAKGDVRKAMVLFNQMNEMGFETSIRDYSAVINRLCKRDLVDDAKLFLQVILTIRCQILSRCSCHVTRRTTYYLSCPVFLRVEALHHKPFLQVVQASLTISLLQSDIKTALKTAFSSVDSPLFVTDWCRVPINPAPLEPYATPKHMNYYFVCPNIDPLTTAAADFFQQLGTGRSHSVLMQLTSRVPGTWKAYIGPRIVGPPHQIGSELDASLRPGTWDNSWQTSRGGGVGCDPSRTADVYTQDETRCLFEPLFIRAEPGSLEVQLLQEVEILVLSHNLMHCIQMLLALGIKRRYQACIASMDGQDWRWLVCIWTDSRSELLDSYVYPFGGVSSRHDTKGLQSIFIQILEQGCQILKACSPVGGIAKPRDCVITQIGCFSELECQANVSSRFFSWGNSSLKVLVSKAVLSMRKDSWNLSKEECPLVLSVTLVDYSGGNNTTQENLGKGAVKQLGRDLSSDAKEF
ncbi:Tetratricopeptide repeat (TPR)-like superfamily protein [Abeliophyllum distichum]|uniref:Tetratricopeptide repeat (TPR)-like superfamily protein n=1 Tax=Abeliophyllum distichum TaxID=126358 RepID=A0ABD1P8I5_9LAMI